MAIARHPWLHVAEPSAVPSAAGYAGSRASNRLAVRRCGSPGMLFSARDLLAAMQALAPAPNSESADAGRPRGGLLASAHRHRPGQRGCRPAQCARQACRRDRPRGHFGFDGAVLLTSRVSVEMVQKAAMIGAPVIIAVSAPTTLAIQTAEEAGITLLAIARDDGYGVFTHPHRIVLPGNAPRPPTADLHEIAPMAMEATSPELAARAQAQSLRAGAIASGRVSFEYVGRLP